VVANKVQASLAEISKADFEASIECPVKIAIPYDLKAASNAAKLGQTFSEANRSSKAAHAIREIAEIVLGAEDDEDGGARKSAKPSLLGKFDLKAMLPKKDKAKAAAGADADAYDGE
jgi:pilus assembly protein CpaE